MKETSLKQSLVCCGCSCLCDDISYLGNQPVACPPELCEKGKEWFASLVARTDHHCSGQEVEFEIALSQARALIARSRLPLIVGLDGLCIASQQAAFRLADRLRAVIDVALLGTGRGGLNALQRVGRVTATIGEVVQRSSVVLVWFADPVSTHPRAWERFIRPQRDSERMVIVVGERESESARLADQFIQLDRSQAATALAVLRALLLKCRMEESQVIAQTGVPLDRWQALLEAMLMSPYGAILSSASHGRHAGCDFDSESEQLARFVRALNDRTRVVSLAMRTDGNAQGAENVLAWSCGFPSAVSFHRGYPRSCFAEYTAETLLSEQSCDLILLASLNGAGDARQKMSAAARAHFDLTPKIVLNELGEECEFAPEVEFGVLRPGFSGTGDFCRLDDIAIPLSSIRPTEEIPSAGEVLDLLN